MRDKKIKTSCEATQNSNCQLSTVNLKKSLFSHPKNKAKVINK
jgi:hypothetical protein